MKVAMIGQAIPVALVHTSGCGLAPRIPPRHHQMPGRDPTENGATSSRLFLARIFLAGLREAGSLGAHMSEALPGQLCRSGCAERVTAPNSRPRCHPELRD